MLRMMDRTKPRGKPQLMPTLATFAYSGAWHGLTTGNLTCFIMLGLLDNIFKLADKTKLAATVLEKVPFAVIWPIKWTFTYFLMCWIVLGNDLIFYSLVIEIHRSLYFSGHILLVLFTIIFMILPKKKSSPSSKDVVKDTKE